MMPLSLFHLKITVQYILSFRHMIGAIAEIHHRELDQKHRKRNLFNESKKNSGTWFRSRDIRVMSPARFRCAIPLVEIPCGEGMRDTHWLLSSRSCPILAI
jgi:hypothetical protein